MKIAQLDKNLIWHPFTQHKTAGDILPIVKGEGSYLYDENGKAYLDLISSWWVNAHGHANRFIARAIAEQAEKLEHVIFAGFTHEPAVKLAQNLSSILPKQLSRLFYSDNGSTATEVALKMAYQYWNNKGCSKRKRFIAFDGGYHGDTFGAMSVGVNSGFHDKFKDLFFDVLILPYPASWQGDSAIEEKEAEAIAQCERYIEQYGDEISAFIFEPLVQGASGMRMCRSSFLRKLVNLMRDNNILLIFDEVMTGFGRTACNFAFEHLDIVPDFLCVSKALTGGFLPLAITITSEQIYSAFLDDSFGKAFAHGHSYTANPLACSAAIASLQLLCSNQCQDAIKDITVAHAKHLSQLQQDCERVNKIRRLGTIAAFDVDLPAQDIASIKIALQNSGFLLRPLGQSFYILPPYSIAPEELADCYAELTRLLAAYN